MVKGKFSQLTESLMNMVIIPRGVWGLLMVLIGYGSNGDRWKHGAIIRAGITCKKIPL